MGIMKRGGMGKALGNNPSGVDSRCARKGWTGDPTRVWNARRLVSLQIRTNPTTPAVGRCTCSSGFKLHVVLEALQSNGTDAEVAEVYNAHPAMPLSRKTNPKKSGSKAFGGSDKLKKKIADLELAEIDCPTGQDLGTPPEAASW